MMFNGAITLRTSPRSVMGDLLVEIFQLSQSFRMTERANLGMTRRDKCRFALQTSGEIRYNSLQYLRKETKIIRNSRLMVNHLSPHRILLMLFSMFSI